MQTTAPAMAYWRPADTTPGSIRRALVPASVFPAPLIVAIAILFLVAWIGGETDVLAPDWTGCARIECDGGWS
ncbi:hypothetical protein [uncultured Rhodospira sp.]|uniref:hypothetical protein n=1 Tax=uncultured Rhodospira sp. TaxID=1936189 RepID=UPI00262A5F56|nr:hypothetical protein [uncultured Rhodospira sp.]